MEAWFLSYIASICFSVMQYLLIDLFFFAVIQSSRYFAQFYV